MLSAFRVLRVIRVLRLISFIPHGRPMVDALLGALRNMAAAFVTWTDQVQSTTQPALRSMALPPVVPEEMRSVQVIRSLVLA
jgi:hypothetical protein